MEIERQHKHLQAMGLTFMYIVIMYYIKDIKQNWGTNFFLIDKQQYLKVA